MSALDAGGCSEFFRCVNDRIVELSIPNLHGVETLGLICECPDAACAQRMPMTPGEYQALREMRGLYAVVPGHHDFTVDEIVACRDGYVVVRPFTAPASAAAA